MSEETFSRILEGIGQFSPVPGVFFGGYGEPLTHPRILEMVRAVKARGAAAELITNAVLLTDEKISGLIAARLDRLWISIDGSRPEGYADVRLGAALPGVLANLERLVALRRAAGAGLPRLGIAFVAMQRNLAELPEVVRLGSLLGADSLSVTHVLAHTRLLREQVLYGHFFDGKDAQPGALPIYRAEQPVRALGRRGESLPAPAAHPHQLPG